MHTEAPLPQSVVLGGQRTPVIPIESISRSLPVAEDGAVSIAVESIATSDTAGAALLELRFSDENGHRVTIPGWAHRSARVGEYVYLTPGDANSPSLDEFSLKVPPGAVRLDVIGHRWKRAVETGVVGDLVLNVDDGREWQATMPSGLPLRYSAKHLKREQQLRRGTSAIHVRARHVAKAVSSSGPVAVEFFDAEGTVTMPVADMKQSPAFGPYFTLDGEPGHEIDSEFVIEVPPEAASVRLKGMDWGKKTASLVGPVEIEEVSERSSLLSEFVSEVPKDAPLLIIDTTAPPLGHETLSLRPNNLTAAYSRLGIWVIFLPFSSLQDKPARPFESVLQVPRVGFDAMIEEVSEARRGLENVYVCSSFPGLQAVATATLLKTLGWTVIYEARDDMEEFNRVGYSKWYSPLLEKRMLRLADKVVSVSTALDEKLVAMVPDLKVHTVIPNAVNRTVIDEGAPLRTFEAAQRRRNSRRIGYVGHLTASWFDWPLVIAAANVLHDVEFEIVGHGMPESLDLPANVRYLGPKSHDQLPTIVADWSVGLIPFANLPLTRSVDPNKIYEYFAWGLRCVTAPMGKVEEYPSTTVYRSLDEFVNAVQNFLILPMDEQELSELELFIQEADWDARARECLAYFGVEYSLNEDIDA